ncbi:hypothetical protein PHLCEN_2v2430 [Hermanssonia centrifuga]|uniref:Carrier domain-containing protein n=1 Tax=Hermanssonia centrifuga TaxID=98765 RepID=A0A2R6RLV7_9APHY|nr:hypothetical protein PHLCEN_2v2430 [Hermanssonia centrifuga]
MAAYLTCTAAQAPQNHGFVSLNQLLESRASSHPHLDVAAFPELTDGTWKVTGFTYSSLFLASNAAAHCYIRTSSLSARTDSSQRIVALLAPSGADLLVTLFAALRLGYAVLLLAPQNTPEAIAHLCRTTSATHLICHPSLRSRPIADIQIIELVPRDIWKNSDPIVPLFLTPDEEMDMPALVMHTSGSTGMPKPVYHPHRIWTQAIPCIPGEPAFTTTPLFHGGSADLLRAMNALSTLYLFSSTHPITVSNILGAMSATTSRITAFLSVPYILKMLAEDPRGLQMLQRMELVSTGGAPLPEALGDEMVRRGVRLVSRLGSSECGFLMSSHREYETDREWSWLRDDSAPSPTPLRFEPAGEDDEFELVVPREWTTRVVANREDGSFATGDLYVPHRSIPHAWQYRGRTDDIVVLTNGKKVSAQPLESALRASPHIAEAIVFGASRASLGVLVLPSTTSPTAGPGMILSCVAQLNQTTPPYAHILPALVVVLPLSHGASLPRTSKGSLVRPRALVQYAEAIDGAYRRFEEGGGGEEAGDVRGYVRRVVMEAVRQKQAVVVGDDEDLFELGVDSLQAMAIRNALQKTVGAGRVLGSTVVYDFPSVNK